MTKPIKIIGISPGTRYMGYAVFCGSDLMDWGVKNIEGKWSNKKIGKVMSVISDLTGHYMINVLSIKELHPSRSSVNLDRVVSGIKELSKSKGLRICQYSIGELENFFCPGEKINRRDLTEMVASRYPILSHELDRERTIINPYYVRMFEAVALGSICFSHLDRRR
jgi:hypothetical protein